MFLNPQTGKKLVAAIFSGVGCGDDEAAAIADHLVEANLAGHDSHGIIRVPIYITWLAEKKVIANQSLEVVNDSGALLVTDGGLGFGQWIGKQVVDLGIERARQYGVGIVALRNTGHLGRIGHWSELAAEAGMISLHFVNTSGLGMFVVPSGGIEPRLSVNPISIGVPVDGHRPIIFDIAAAATAEGKLKVARNKGVPVPEGWIVDAAGQPTTDPNDFYGPPAGAILPMGGHKGSGLGFMIELLAGALTGSGCSVAGKTQLEQGMLGIYIDPLKLQAAETLFPEIVRYTEWVKSARPADPSKPVLVPGEMEDTNRAQRTETGIKLDEKTWSQLKETATNCGVADDVIKSAVINE